MQRWYDAYDQLRWYTSELTIILWIVILNSSQHNVPMHHLPKLISAFIKL